MSLDLTPGDAGAARITRGTDPPARTADPGGTRAADGRTTDAAGRRTLESIAAEFESMLMLQVLRDMRRAGAWDDDGRSGALGAESLFDTLDTELASHLAQAQGFGLRQALLTAFDRMHDGTGAGTADPDGPASGGPADVAAPPAGDARPRITSAFGWRRDPLTGTQAFHKGIDVEAAYGQDVQAAGAGRVVFSGTQGGYGTTVLIEHANGLRTRYAHLSETFVAEGSPIAAGQTIGRAGRSGRATGPHLHFEVTDPQGNPVDPGTAAI